MVCCSCTQQWWSCQQPRMRTSSTPQCRTGTQVTPRVWAASTTLSPREPCVMAPTPRSPGHRCKSCLVHTPVCGAAAFAMLLPCGGPPLSAWPLCYCKPAVMFSNAGVSIDATVCWRVYGGWLIICAVVPSYLRRYVHVALH